MKFGLQHPNFTFDGLRKVEAFRDAGIDYLIVNLEPDRESQALELFANEVVKKL